MIGEGRETRCGSSLLRCYPSLLQRFARPKMFLVFFSLKSIAQGMLFTYLVGVTTSVERHFQLSSRQTGLFVTLGELGPVSTSLLLSFYGGRGNRPRWMGIGLGLVALSCAMLFSTAFIFPPPDYFKSKTDEGPAEIVVGPKIHRESLCSARSYANSTLMSSPQCTVHKDSTYYVFVIWFVAYSLLGIGGTTVYTVGAPYLDDSVDKKDSPVYFGISTAVRLVGPALGYVLSASCLKLFVHPSVDPGVDHRDARWIGAWWLGLFVMGFLNGFFAVLMALFPPVLESATKREVKQEGQNSDAKKSDALHLKELWVKVRRLMQNPILVCSAASSFLSVLGLAGYFIWMPKFFEHQFRVSKGQASMLAGMAGSVTMIFGILGSGLLMRKLKPRARTVAAYVAGCKYLYAAGVLGLMFVGCQEDVTKDNLPGLYASNGSLLLTSACNSACHCGTESFAPVCDMSAVGTQQRTYFSPCHAGCRQEFRTNSSGKEIVSYTNCTCLLNETAILTKGRCESPCNALTTYSIILAIVKFIVSTSIIGNFIIDLRCVATEDKAVALGFLSTIVAALGVLPAPLIYGFIVDSTCLVWEESCGQRGACWVYDVDAFRFRFHLLTACFLAAAGIFEVITYYKAGSLKLIEDDDQQENGDAISKIGQSYDNKIDLQDESKL